jgi:hypothetical protein
MNPNLLPELRQIFQDMLNYTITESEARELLSRTRPNLVLWSIKATKKKIERNSLALTPDETLDMVKMYIGNANADREAIRTSPPQVIDLAAKQAAEQRRKRAEEALIWEGREDERGR